MLGPALAPLLDQFGLVPVAHLRAEAVLLHFAHGQHDMRVGLRLAVRADIPMDIEIGDHALFDELGFTKSRASSIPCCLFSSRGIANSTSRASCASLRFSAASTAFQSFSRSANSGGAPFGQHHFGMNDAILVGEVMVAVEPLIVQPFACAIGCRRHRTAPARRG
jgi:hypothetical protein